MFRQCIYRYKLSDKIMAMLDSIIAQNTERTSIVFTFQQSVQSIKHCIIFVLE